MNQFTFVVDILIKSNFISVLPPYESRGLLLKNGSSINHVDMEGGGVSQMCYYISNTSKMVHKWDVKISKILSIWIMDAPKGDFEGH